MNVKFSPLFRSAGLLAGALLTLAGVRAAEADALPTFDTNYIKVSTQGVMVSDSKAAFQKGTQMSRTGTAGIEEFNYTYDLSKETNLQVDGHLLAGSEDYLTQFKLTTGEVGSIEIGYKTGRTYYDGAGGFFPLNNAWLPIYSRQLYVDRSKFFVNGTISRPNLPVVTFRFTSERRSGRKDSTIWGDTDFTGVPIYSSNALNPVSANRKLVPAYIQLGERQQTWEVGLKQTFGNTTAVVSIAGDKISNLDTRSVDRYPGELKPYPAIPSNPPTLVAPAIANNQNKGFDQQGIKMEGFTVASRVETTFNDKIKGFFAANLHQADGDISASRLITGSLNTAVGRVDAVGIFTSGARPPYSYTSAGRLKTETWTGTLGVETTLVPDLSASVAVKAEQLWSSGNNQATYVNNLLDLTTGVVTQQLVAAPNSYKLDEQPWTPEVDVRYTGFKNIALFSSWDYRTSPGYERTFTTSVTPSAAVILPVPGSSASKVKEKHSNFTIGGNWTPRSGITLRGEFFTKDHENRFNGYGTSIGDLYILDYDIYGARLSARVKLLPTLTSNTRYVVQRGAATIMEKGYVEGDSNDARRFQLTQTFDWNPSKLVYVQANAHIVWDKMSTSYPRAGGSANDVLHNADNNYWNSSVVTGYVIDKDTDAQIQATYYKSNNYNAALVATDPYGAGARDYSLTVGLKHKFSDRMVGSVKVGYFDGDSTTTGGFANYQGTIGYLSLDYRL